MPFVSVIIPTYNHAVFIRDALDSVFQQTFDDFEVIVVDNYSEDNTEDLVRSYNDSRLRYMKFRNQGIIGASRNVGVRNATGELVAFLDSDDLWYPRKLELCVQAFSREREIILVCHDEYCTREGKILKRYHYGPYTENMYHSLLFKKNCVSTSAAVLKRDIHNKLNGFSENKDFVGCEDYEFWMRLSREGKFYFIPEVMGEYRIHGKNMISNPVRLACNVLRVLEHHYMLLPSETQVQARKKYKRRHARVMASCAKSLFLNKNIKGLVWAYKAFQELAGSCL